MMNEKLIALNKEGHVFSLELTTLNEDAHSMFAKIIKPDEFYILRLNRDAHLFYNTEGNIQAVIRMPSITIRTHFSAAKDSANGNEYIYPSWFDGVKTMRKWTPPPDFTMFLSCDLRNSCCGAAAVLNNVYLILVDTNTDKHYAAPLKNVSRIGTVCTGELEKSVKDTKYFRDLEFLTSLVDDINSTLWNNDLGGISDCNYRKILKWDKDGEQIDPSYECMLNVLCELSVSPISKFMTKEFFKRCL